MNNSLCKYKNIFGEPNKGLHAYRIFDIAIIDVLATILVAMILAYYTKYSFVGILILLFLLGIVMHRVFCVKTTIDKWLFS